METVKDITSGDVHRAVPAVLIFLLRMSLAAFVIATFAPYILPDANHATALVGGVLVAGLGTFLKFS